MNKEKLIARGSNGIQNQKHVKNLDFIKFMSGVELAASGSFFLAAMNSF